MTGSQPPSMQLGINLSFCVKRWVTPELWAPIVREQLDLDLVQLSFDLVDPMWPDDVLQDCARDIRAAADQYSIAIHSAFIGLAHYTFNQLLHPNARVRDVAEEWMTRAYRFAGLAGINRVGGPLGAIASRTDGVEMDSIPASDYDDLIARLNRLSVAAQRSGIVELYIEPTPMRREWPWTISQAQRMAADLAGTPVPWKFCLDWGHATFEPLYGRYRARMAQWLQDLAPHVGMVHVQQTDFQYDRHWDFTETGAVNPAEAARLQREAGLANQPVFLEVFYPFERDDASILKALAHTISVLKPAFA
ncbi:sugar phosphate isomerase/epimerase (plasmid) [Phyllobacterium sp. A18/5-2]|uniref:sugar phosphate isomerase/epimerase family protein n=1 Tax=Phyllobacterium sp. A18/5-2 TaxID=2978392 RepID=UPI0021C84F8F|nr:sugar phosphate isomerase/epimerase [Phyllobacterium sp. A18/5-2]UXN66375.1 sugar phosphate isomerase/epimerase [Phyllobacterium sp. A18/5-2]